MKLYFGNAVAAATTLILLALLGFVGYSIYKRDNIQYWGRRSALLLTFGLVACCFAPGLNPLISIPTIVGCAGALLIIIAAIAAPIAKTQRAREIWFYVMSGGAVLKIVTMEIARSIL